MASYGDAILGARVHINDSVAPNRFGDTVLLGFAKDAIREMVSHRYDLFETPCEIACQDGVEQRLPDPERQLYLIDLYECENGGVIGSIEEASLETLRRHRSNWRADTPAAAENWARYPKEPGKRDDSRFVIYPPALAGQVVRGVCSAVPDQAGATTATILPVSDEYLPALSAYVAYRAEVIDDENVLSARASALYSLFMSIIGAAEAEQATEA